MSLQNDSFSGVLQALCTCVSGIQGVSWDVRWLASCKDILTWELLSPWFIGFPGNFGPGQILGAEAEAEMLSDKDFSCIKQN